MQPPGNGPYLIGGHSYGGTVAMQIALLLESWGHDVGLVLVGEQGGGCVCVTVCAGVSVCDGGEGACGLAFLCSVLSSTRGTCSFGFETAS